MPKSAVPQPRAGQTRVLIGGTRGAGKTFFLLWLLQRLSEKQAVSVVIDFAGMEGRILLTNGCGSGSAPVQ